MQPLDPQVHYGISDRDFLDVHDVRMDLLPDKLHLLRWKLNQKAKKEPKFRFYALYDRVYRMDMLESAWKHVGKKGEAAGIDGVKAEDNLGKEGGVEEFLVSLQGDLRSKSYRPSPVKQVYIPKADGGKRFVVMARYQGYRIDEWLDAKLEGWLGLTINREKTKVVNLGQAESLDFLGFMLRCDRDLYGSAKTYLNVTPSKKSLKKAQDAICEETRAKKCFKPPPAVVKDLNTFLRGWSGYFDFGYPRKAFRDLSNYARKRMVTHLNRRSQRKYHRSKGMSHYQYLQELGLQRL